MNRKIKFILRLSAISTAIALSSHSFASGYKMEFQSASVLGDAGEAAVVEDAGTNWYNSAGLVNLPQQLVLSGIDVYAPSTFSGTAQANSVFGPAFSYTGNGSASSHPNNYLPALHYSLPLSPNWAIGYTAAPAWGFMEDYGAGSLVRYDLTRVYTRTIDLAPSVAYRLNNHWSFGIGPDFHYFSVESKSHVRTQGPAFFGGTPIDSVSRFSANSWGYGGHVGALYSIDDHNRIGINYRSKIYMNMKGYSDFTLGDGPSFESNDFRLPIPLPPTTTLSAYHDMTPCWALMGTIAYDQWSVLRDYHASGDIQPPSAANPSGILPSVVEQQNMRNTVDYSIGTHFKINQQVMLRGSIKYEPTPTKSAFRDINFPDGDKLGIQIGSRYEMSKKIAVDLLYGHVFIRTKHINGISPLSLPTTGQAISTTIGHQRASADLFGAQLVWSI